MEESSLPLHLQLNLQTARISWPEIERFFARGRVLEVSADLDLIKVAEALVQDDTEKFTVWTKTQKVQHLSDQHAQQWVTNDKHLWAVVVAPWVIVQNRQ